MTDQEQPRESPERRRSSLRKSLTRRMFSTRDNSMYKWQNKKGIVGCLEVQSEPMFDYEERLKPLMGIVQNSEEKEEEYMLSFGKAVAAWDNLDMRQSFVAACRSMPVSTLCCGLMRDEDKTVRDLVPHLNQVWSEHASERMESAGFSVDCFLWSWRNLQGKSETLVLLVRFFDLAKVNASDSGQLRDSMKQRNLASTRNLRGSSRDLRSSSRDLRSSSRDLRSSSRNLRSSTGRKSLKSTSGKSLLRDSSLRESAKSTGGYREDIRKTSTKESQGSTRSNVTAESSSGAIVVPEAAKTGNGDIEQ
eukprot:CAMPEP_0197433820 /NCGR_PEP_ID=MMETSP1175-20131217/1631_1 /TAXON_ID=1003142 /ORGANISM="Triceratium dubium, Strain CCMP147" /LENGTH=305 /DNA_ID=CAMNT_0042962321 /DNA_START=403 /DNA_END=1320 /DNA_ORIENTATION=+